MKFLLFFPTLIAFVGSAANQPTTCPLIYAKPAAECSGKVSECWSPGQPDVDCTGNGLCCFDGCVNVCDIPNCKTIQETRFENLTTENCQPIPQEPICKVVHHQDCWDSCKVVDEVIPRVVNEEVCSMTVEPVCKDVEMEVCTPPVVPTATTCQLVHAKPQNDCAGQAPSDCWSPGVLDLDCDNGTGLCCFDGCRNRCTKACYKEPYEDCVDILTDTCKGVPSGECSYVDSPIKVPMVTRTCTHMKKACMTMAKIDCTGDLLGDCKEVTDTKCTEATQEECSTSTTLVEKLVTFNKCKSTTTTVCEKVPKKSCLTKYHEVCPKCIPTKVSHRKCEDVSRNVCNSVPKTINETVSKNVCEKVCQPREEKSCTYPEPKTVCEPVVSFKPYQILVTKCGEELSSLTSSDIVIG